MDSVWRERPELEDMQDSKRVVGWSRVTQTEELGTRQTKAFIAPPKAKVLYEICISIQGIQEKLYEKVS